MSLDFNNYYFNTAKSVIENINQKKIENIVKQLNILRKNKLNVLMCLYTILQGPIFLFN